MRIVEILHRSNLHDHRFIPLINVWKKFHTSAGNICSNAQWRQQASYFLTQFCGRVFMYYYTGTLIGVLDFYIHNKKLSKDLINVLSSP